jgi:hypothetical protein
VIEEDKIAAVSSLFINLCHSVFKPKKQIPRWRGDGDEIIRSIVGNAAAG